MKGYRVIEVTEDPPLDDQSCDNCRYWKAGECRRRAPNSVQGWTSTYPTDWCGDWQAQ